MIIIIHGIGLHGKHYVAIIFNDYALISFNIILAVNLRKISLGIRVCALYNVNTQKFENVPEILGAR